MDTRSSPRRLQAIALHEAGQTNSAIARGLGISRSRVDQFLSPEKASARSLLAAAVKAGRLVRPKRCSACDANGPIEAHHPDYSQPLAVLWLCRQCHGHAHASPPSPPQEPDTVEPIIEAALRAFGDVREDAIDAAARAIASNLVVASPRPGGCCEVFLAALACRCARCGYVWFVYAHAPGELASRPERCAGCDARTWDQTVPRRAGRPPVARPQREA